MTNASDLLREAREALQLVRWIRDDVSQSGPAALSDRDREALADWLHCIAHAAEQTARSLTPPWQEQTEE
ncbi:MAG: hypothetical protein K6T61_18070 [Bryobacteraceae bacterium]|nr:hypothetical protein [Bryobacteraceae bacterium]